MCSFSFGAYFLNFYGDEPNFGVKVCAIIALAIIAITSEVNGYEITQITFEPNYESQPAWSPDGSKIAFVSYGEIYLMDADGSDQKRLTHSQPGYGATRPAWSPDSTKIAYTSVYRLQPSLKILNIIDINNGSVTELQKASMLKGHSFSPDGNYIVVSGCSGWDVCTPQIYKINLNTNEVTFLGEGTEPAWSPDSKKIAFVSYTYIYPSLYPDISIMDANGTGAYELTNSRDAISPAWSPDGTHIAFCSSRRGNFDIYTISPTGGKRFMITVESSADDRDPTWSPNASKIAFGSNGDIWVVSNGDIGELSGIPTRTSDINNDGIVDLLDLKVLANSWLQREPLVDIVPDSGDGVIDFRDLAKLVGEWLKTEPWYQS
jgi:Tol biopolymer transport system component